MAEFFSSLLVRRLSLISAEFVSVLRSLTRVLCGRCTVPSLLVQSPFHHSTHGCRAHHDDGDFDDVGERVLRETRYDREQRVRLREIEDDLARLTSSEVGKVPPPALLLPPLPL